MAYTSQSISAGALQARMGGSGFNGISGAIGATTTTVDVTIATGAWAIYKDGTFVDTIAQPGIDPSSTTLTYLANVSVPIGSLADASNYYLYLSHSTDGLYAPTWYISTSANKVNSFDLQVAAVTISGGIVTVVTNQGSGLTESPKQPKPAADGPRYSARSPLLPADPAFAR